MVSDQTQKANYYPFRSAHLNSNGMFFTTSELQELLNQHIVQEGVPESQLADYKQALVEWQAFSEFLLIFQSIHMHTYQIVTAANSPLIKIWSVFGEQMAIFSIESQLPYKWNLQLNKKNKMLTKLVNSVRVLKRIKHQYPQFIIQDGICQEEDETQEDRQLRLEEAQDRIQKESEEKGKTVVFQNLIEQCVEEDQLINKANTASLKQMEMRKSKKII